MKFGILLTGILGLVVAWSEPAVAQGKQEALVEQVKRAIDKGVSHLRRIQRPNGGWELADGVGASNAGGETCLVVLALLNSGVPVTDNWIKSGLEQVRQIRPSTTYVYALQTMALAEAGRAEDKERIQKNLEWLINARIMSEGKLQGWHYGRGAVSSGDNSNTQYAVLGLYAAKSAGVPVPQDVWKSVLEYYTRTQQADGGWLYNKGEAFGNRSSLTMTTAGLSGLLIAGMELNVGREKIVDGGPALNCGVYQENEPIAKALSWIRKEGFHDRFALEIPGRTFYNLYGIERAGRLSGRRFFGEHDWYREGCKFLVEKQHADGSWHLGGGFGGRGFDQWPAVSTSFALLFLSKGRTPVLISKLVHRNPRLNATQDDLDWNNDRFDARNLTEFSSRELFKKMPLAWQIFDVNRALEKGGISEEEITSDLLQSPIVYFNGHESPLRRFTDREKDVLKRYIENGGFILAEACCGSRKFDKGFQALVKEMWPDVDLIDLPREHAIWSAHYPVPSGSFGLKGLQMGCKTVLVYSPEDLSCLWESNRFDQGKAQLAFRLGANIVAYATGMEPPRPRLSQTELASDKDDRRTAPRGYFKIAQLKHGGDWQPAPRAMRNLMDHLNKTAGLDVALQTEQMDAGQPSMTDFKFLYMHGRGDFSYGDREAEKLRFNLKTGGLLFADACCGSDAFDRAFRAMVAKVFLDAKVERVPVTDPLFGKDLNGNGGLTERNIRVRRERGGQFQNAAPFLEGVKLDGRWVILYSKYDIGCALERHQSSDCLGYDPASALRLGSAAVLYLLRP